MLDKIRTINHFNLQEINADVLNGLGDEQFQNVNNFVLAYLAGFFSLDSLILRDMVITKKAGGGNEWTLESGLQGIFLLKKDTEDAIAGIYKGVRPTPASPWEPEDLVFSNPDPTDDRIDLIELDIVEEPDTDYSETVTMFDQGTEESYPDTKITKRVQQVKLYIKEGTPAPSPVPPTVTTGRMAVREVIIRTGSSEIAAIDILGPNVDPALDDWTGPHDTRILPPVLFLYDGILENDDDISVLESDITDLQSDKYDKVGGLISGLVTANNGLNVFNALLTANDGMSISGSSGYGIQVGNGNINLQLGSLISHELEPVVGYLDDSVANTKKKEPIYGKWLSGQILDTDDVVMIPHGVAFGRNKILCVIPHIDDTVIYNQLSHSNSSIKPWYTEVDNSVVYLVRGLSSGTLTVKIFILYME